MSCLTSSAVRERVAALIGARWNLILGIVLLNLGSIRVEAVALSIPSETNVIELTVPGSLDYWSDSWSKDSIAQFSPDLSKFIVVVRKGDVLSNTNRYSMLLWHVNELLSGIKAPHEIAALESATNFGDVNEAEWDHDNRTVWFLGQDKDNLQQVFTVDTLTGTLTQITHHATSVLAYSHSADGTSVAYLAERPSLTLWTSRNRQRGIDVSSLQDVCLADLILGRNDVGQKVGRDEAVAADLFVQRYGNVRQMHMVGSANAYDTFLKGPESVSLSPNGRYVVVATDVPAEDVPQAWRDLGVVTKAARPDCRGRARSGRQVYEILDVETGLVRRLLDTPIHSSAIPIWSPQGDTVILSELYMAGPRDRNLARVAGIDTVEFTLATGSATSFAGACYQAVEWEQHNNVLLCRSEVGRTDRPVITELLKSNGTWKRTGERIPARNRLSIELREDMNTPPKLYARLGEQAPFLVLDLNPQLSNLSLAKVKEITWTSGRVGLNRAGLYVPQGYIAGRKYPLVIQGHGWLSDRFSMDGYSPTGYAAQAMAGRGIFVLQVNDMSSFFRYRDHPQPQQEMSDALAIYRSAVRYLASRGLVDERRVGLLGWSHTCDYVAWALTRDPKLFSAAVCAGETTGGYLAFMSNQVGGNSDFRALYGGAPVAPHLHNWLRNSPSFNLDRVQTPLQLYVLSAPLYLPMEWEWYEGLRMLGKPVDMVMLEDATHVLVKPSDRLAVSGGAADWFDYWLNSPHNGHVPSVSGYLSWRAQREGTDAN